MVRKTVFDFAAQVGLTKHMGGLEATEEMVTQCHIGGGTLVLGVGCGGGTTACYLARRRGTRSWHPTPQVTHPCVPPSGPGVGRHEMPAAGRAASRHHERGERCSRGIRGSRLC
jgi:hypothetical protein